MTRPRLPFISIVFVALLAFGAETLRVLPPRVSSDTVSYMEAMDVVAGRPTPVNFAPNRLLTTYPGLLVLRGFEALGIPRLPAWSIMNVWFYALGLSACYLFFRSLFGGEKEAVIGTLLLATSYPAISFGLNYLMDMGGWAAYLISLLFSFRYFKNGRSRDAWIAAVVSGAGGLFKEYGFLALIPLALALFHRLYQGDRSALRTGIVSVLFFGIPPLLLYTYLYQVYGYTYLDWFALNQGSYGNSYASRIKELIKVFGSLLTFLWFLVIPGVYLFVRRGREILSKDSFLFIIFLAVSALPLFLWPAITQRIYFIPLMVLVLFAQLSLRWMGTSAKYAYPLLVLYVLANYTMDSYILPNFSSDALLNYFF